MTFYQFLVFRLSTFASVTSATHTQLIKNEARRLGFDFCGISKAEFLSDEAPRLEKWLKENTYTTPLLKWETDVWGEVPADFGRK